MRVEGTEFEIKNQYFGDIGDYGKNGLLRFLAMCGVNIAINWYLTPDDQSNDGNIRGYLAGEKDRIYDPGLFDVLREFSARNERDVHHFAALDMIPGAIYFDEIVEPVVSKLNAADKRKARERWHHEALAACDGASLVFMDPDNGLKAGKPTARKDAMKFVYASEVVDYYERGQDVVYYCHKGRRTDVQWEKAKHIMRDYCPDATLMGFTYHRGTQRSYIFVIHPERKERYHTLLKGFMETEWKDCFTDENIS